MKKIYIYSHMLILSAISAQGTVEINYFYSEALQVDCGYTIHLPEGYNDSDEHYPTLYFLHGFGTNHYLFYGGIHDIMDSLVSVGQVDPFIIVRPDGSTSPYLGSFYTNSALYGDFEDYIIYDLIEHIDNTYRTIDHRLYRGISGHSMGGYGATKLGIKYYDLFGSVSSHSGALVFDNLTDLIPDLMDETWWNPFGLFMPTNGLVSLFMFGASGAFSPNLDLLPWYVDLPVDYNGDIIQSVWDLWMPHDPQRIAQDSISVLPLLDYYLDCGDQDEYYFEAHAMDFHAFLDSFNLDHEYHIYSGYHWTNIDSRYAFSLIHHNNAFGDPAYIMGDLNGDGMITPMDTMTEIQIIMNNTFYNMYNSYAGDMDYNDEVDIMDLLLISDNLNLIH
jgi:S-formylglutathione hydrolase FrmB